ncbi:MAG: hypothetical protein CV088_21460 [Nitrospira sp. LK70]|nr:hypothetical protein [Nitrospira sp. LK70]
MSTVFRGKLSIGLAIILLYLSGVVAAQSAEHTVHHAHHQAAMHASLLCSWLCAAGQAIEVSAVDLQAHQKPLIPTDLHSAQNPVEHVASIFLSRAPPSPRA